MSTSFFATLLFCMLILMLFGAIFYLSNRGAISYWYRSCFSTRAYWYRIFLRGSKGYSEETAKAAETFAEIAPILKAPFAHKQRERRPWEPRAR